MSATLLENVQAFVEAAGYHTGYAKKYFRWTDADVTNSTPFILYRHPGSTGESNQLMQQLDVLIQLVATPTTVKTADTLMNNILKLFRGTTTPTGVVRADPMGGVSGPFYLENGRPVFELIVRCITETDQ